MTQMVGLRTPPVELVPAKLAARLLGVHQNTLCKWRIAGRGPRFVKMGRRVAYRLSDIEKWANQRTYSNTAQCQQDNFAER